MNQQLRDAYWALVRECLTHFHGLPAAEADQRVEDFLRYMRDAPEGIDTDIVFNREAFERACELAEHELDSRSFWGEYMAMMDRHYAHVPIPQTPKGSSISQELKDAYWAILRECLIRFHGLSDAEAGERVADLIHDMENAPEGIDTDIVSNNEAFDLASNLAGRELELRPYLDEYLAMMDRHYAHVPVLAPARSTPTGYLPAA